MFISNLAFLDAVSQETEVSGGGRKCHYNGGYEPSTCPPICLTAFQGFALGTAYANAEGYQTSAISDSYGIVLMNDDNTTGSSEAGSYAAASVGF